MVEERTIETAAILDDEGKPWSLPRPARHSNVIHLMATSGCPTPIKRGEHGERQGFLLSDGTFADRVEAKRIALLTGQVTEAKMISNDLTSEDLWRGRYDESK